MNGYRHRFPRYGTVGLIVLLLMETAIFCAQTGVFPDFSWWQITTVATPVCWWAYILIIDAWIYQRRGTSLLTARRGSLVIQCILSIIFWCLFEAYNRVMPGWRYINLPADLSARFLGYAIAFATIMPGMFLTCELFQSYDAFERAWMPRVRWSRGGLVGSAVMGALFVLVPPFMPTPARGYLWAFVWMGWFFLLEPFNYWRGMPSIYRDWQQGDPSRMLQLFAAGAVCGLLWEFWNMWAYTKWVYIFPLGQNVKYFQMPLVGFLGFLPFALEYFTMFHFVASFFTRDDKLGL
ncbi:MAG TPA: hypothetical protein VMV72_00145 [Verrucomicrobiae bacterium]|nr:hypothetical protein [Verrucomicrobiae bacterium]